MERDAGAVPLERAAGPVVLGAADAAAADVLRNLAAFERPAAPASPDSTLVFPVRYGLLAVRLDHPG